jgi:hypothetical protein
METLIYDLEIEKQDPFPGGYQVIIFRLVKKDITGRIRVYFDKQNVTINEDGKIIQYYQWLNNRYHQEEIRQLFKHGISFFKGSTYFYKKHRANGTKIARRKQRWNSYYNDNNCMTWIDGKYQSWDDYYDSKSN